METGKAASRQRFDETHFFPYVPLENIAGAPQKTGRIFFDVVDYDFHN